MTVAIDETVEKQSQKDRPETIQPTGAPTQSAYIVSGATAHGRLLRRFRLDEYQHLIELGFFDEDERIELLDGLLVEMSPINPRHAVCVDKLGGLINHLLYKKAWIRVQAPITLEGRSSQPQPDITIALLQPEAYEERHVKAEEILLVVEVADSSLHGDQTDKLEIYASAGIREYWIVNLVDNQLEVYQEPYLSGAGEGNYKVKRTYSRDDTVSLQAFAECQIPLNEVLPRGS
jgi:Uma2 family endonuclease